MQTGFSKNKSKRKNIRSRKYIINRSINKYKNLYAGARRMESSNQRGRENIIRTEIDKISFQEFMEILREIVKNSKEYNSAFKKNVHIKNYNSWAIKNGYPTFDILNDIEDCTKINCGVIGNQIDIKAIGTYTKQIQKNHRDIKKITQKGWAFISKDTASKLLRNYLEKLSPSENLLRGIHNYVLDKNNN